MEKNCYNTMLNDPCQKIPFDSMNSFHLIYIHIYMITYVSSEIKFNLTAKNNG